MREELASAGNLESMHATLPWILNFLDGRRVSAGPSTAPPTVVGQSVMPSLWSRLPLPEQHVAGLLVGLAVDRLTATRLPSWTRPIGLALGAAGVAVNVAAVRAHGGDDLDRPSGLVDRGPYAWTRNPMYLGWSMIHLGAALALRSPGMAITWPVAVILVHRGILAEERQLAARFGADFATYAASVPRYLDRRTLPDRHAVSPCSCAYAAAAVREDTSSLVKMLLRWRATVLWLSTRTRAMSGLLRPSATSRSTSSSRSVSPAGSRRPSS